MLATLETDATPRREATPDERLWTAMTGIRRLQQAGVTFHRTDKGALGYSDPNGAMSPDTYKRFAGLHEAIIAQLHRERLLEQKKKLQAEAAAMDAAAKAEAARADAATTSLDRERRIRITVERQVDDIAKAATARGAMPTEPATPALARLATGVAGLRDDRDQAEARAATAEDRAERLAGALGQALAWLDRKAPGLARGIRRLVHGTLREGDLATARGDAASPQTDDTPKASGPPPPPASARRDAHASGPRPADRRPDPAPKRAGPGQGRGDRRRRDDDAR